MRAKCTQIFFSSSWSSLLLVPATLVVPIVVSGFLRIHATFCGFFLRSFVSSLPCFHEGGTAAVADVTNGELVLFEIVSALRALAEVDVVEVDVT